MAKLTGNIDSRPRVHIRKAPAGFTFRHGPTGMDHVAPTRGEAFERAIEALGDRAAVIIYGDADHG